MEFFTIGFSTFLGAAVALLAEWLTRQRDGRLKEEAAINSLILDLAGKRAFVTGEEWTWGSGEIERVASSIFDARALVREARLALRPRSSALAPLRKMTKACNAFLEQTERRDPEELKGALRALADEMTEQVHALHIRNRRRILSDTPGSFAL